MGISFHTLSPYIIKIFLFVRTININDGHIFLLDFAFFLLILGFKKLEHFLHR